MEESIGKVEVSFTTEKRIGCGHIYLTIMFRRGTFHRLLAKSGGTCDTACADAILAPLLATLTFSIRRVCTRDELVALIEGLRFHRCTKPVLSDPKHRPAVSCSDAVGIILEEKLLPLWIDHSLRANTDEVLTGELLLPEDHPLHTNSPIS